MQNLDTSSSALPPLAASSLSANHLKHVPFIFKKEDHSLNANQKHTQSRKKSESHQIHKKGQHRQEKIDSGESQFEYSEEIMRANPRKQGRKEKQEIRVPILLVFDWMRKTCSILNLSRQVLYRGVMTLRKLLIMQKKKKDSKLTMKNIRFFGLAAILISSKIQNIDGDSFLTGKMRIMDGQLGIDKHIIFDCEIEILTALNFTVPVRSLITESIIKIALKWNFFVKNANLPILRLDCKQKIKTPKEKQEFNMSFLELYLHLIDFVFMRRISEINLKEFEELKNSSFYEPDLANILFNLSYQTLKQFSPGELHHKFRHVFDLFLNKLNPQPQKRNLYHRQSHVLVKHIKRVFSLQRNKNQEVSAELLEKLDRKETLDTLLKEVNSPQQEKQTAQKLSGSINCLINHERKSFIPSKLQKQYELHQLQMSLKTEGQRHTYERDSPNETEERKEEKPQDNRKQQEEQKRVTFLTILLQSETFQFRLAIDHQRYWPIVGFSEEMKACKSGFK